MTGNSVHSVSVFYLAIGNKAKSAANTFHLPWTFQLVSSNEISLCSIREFISHKCHTLGKKASTRAFHLNIKVQRKIQSTTCAKNKLISFCSKRENLRKKQKIDTEVSRTKQDFYAVEKAFSKNGFEMKVVGISLTRFHLTVVLHLDL